MKWKKDIRNKNWGEQKRFVSVKMKFKRMINKTHSLNESFNRKNPQMSKIKFFRYSFEEFTNYLCRTHNHICVLIYIFQLRNRKTYVDYSFITIFGKRSTLLALCSFLHFSFTINIRKYLKSHFL